MATFKPSRDFEYTRLMFDFGTRTPLVNSAVLRATALVVGSIAGCSTGAKALQLSASRFEQSAFQPRVIAERSTCDQTPTRTTGSEGGAVQNLGDEGPTISETEPMTFGHCGGSNSAVPPTMGTAPLPNTGNPKTNSISSLERDTASNTSRDPLGSTYIPVDSWVYPAALRLYSMGFVDTAFISMRPWTRRSVLHMLQSTEGKIVSSDNEEAAHIFAALQKYLDAEASSPDGRDGASNDRGTVYGMETGYTRVMGIKGPTLRDSYHLGQTISNDYGRPYASGFNNISGFSSVNEWGRFSLYLRAEYQHAPAYEGYSYALANQLAVDDATTLSQPIEPTFFEDTIPYGNTGSQNALRLDEAALSFHVLGHEISGGKTDAWLGPGMGGAFGWSNNAENIYSFRINRVEPLNIPLLHRLLGPVRYDFFYGSLKGHNAPNNPWVHSEQFAFRPTANFEFGFQRTVIFGGHGFPRTEPVTLHTFLKGFFDFNDTTGTAKYSRDDPGARFSAFNFSWRLPFLTHWITLYTDSEAHDDASPISAPRRAAYRPGIYLSHVPHISHLDLRVEGVSTDFSTRTSMLGTGNYYETIQRQGYTNKGIIMGDWIGREAKGGQAWLTYHLSGSEHIQLEYMHKKTPKDFVAGGVSQNDIKLELLKRLGHNFELDSWYQFETWQAPVPLTEHGTPLAIVGGALFREGTQTNSTFAGQLTWYPKLNRLPSFGKQRKSETSGHDVTAR